MSANIILFKKPYPQRNGRKRDNAHLSSTSNHSYSPILDAYDQNQNASIIRRKRKRQKLIRKNDVVPSSVKPETKEVEEAAKKGWKQVAVETMEVKKRWKQVLDKETNKYYYWNLDTDEVRWDPPEGFFRKRQPFTPEQLDSFKVDGKRTRKPTSKSQRLFQMFGSFYSDKFCRKRTKRKRGKREGKQMGAPQLKTLLDIGKEYNDTSWDKKKEYAACSPYGDTLLRQYAQKYRESLEKGDSRDI